MGTIGDLTFVAIAIFTRRLEKSNYAINIEIPVRIVKATFKEQRIAPKTAP